MRLVHFLSSRDPRHLKKSFQVTVNYNEYVNAMETFLASFSCTRSLATLLWVTFCIAGSRLMGVVSLFLRLSDLYQCFPHYYLCGEISQILFFKFTAVCSNQSFLTWKKIKSLSTCVSSETRFFKYRPFVWSDIYLVERENKKIVE